MHILLVDTEPVASAALAGQLETLGHRIAIAANAGDAFARLGAAAFEAIVLHLPPGLPMLALLQRLRAHDLTLPALVLASASRPADRIAMLDAGADDVLAMPVDAGELAARLRAMLRGRGWSAAADTLRAGDIVVSPTTMRAWRGQRSLALGRLEFTLLLDLVRHGDGGVTRAGLAERVWRGAIAHEGNAINVAIGTLRAKLTAGGEPDPIVTRRGVGYVLRS